MGRKLENLISCCGGVTSRLPLSPPCEQSRRSHLQMVNSFFHCSLLLWFLVQKLVVLINTLKYTASTECHLLWYIQVDKLSKPGISECYQFMFRQEHRMYFKY